MFYNTNCAILHSLTFPHTLHTHTQFLLYSYSPSANTYTWQTTSLESWPLRSPLQPVGNLAPAPSPAAPAAGQRLLAKQAAPVQTPYGAFLAAQSQPEKLKSANLAEAQLPTPYGAYFAAQPQPEKLTAAKPTEIKQLSQIAHAPQALSAYGALQSTTHGNLVLLNSPYYAAYSLPLAYVAPSVVPIATTAPSVTTSSTAKPTTVEEVEPVDDVEDETDTIETLQKLQAKTQTSGDLKSDKQLRAAVSRINTDYVIEEIVAVPGKHVISTSSKQTVSSAHLKKPKAAAKLRKASAKQSQTPVKVEATGRTSTSSKNFPEIPFGTYFLPYRPEQAKALQGRKQAALVLEPHSKAVVGNGGTAISTPISRALLKKGVPTNVYFNPESVAIAGVGGKAHATADLELDLFN